MQNIKTLFAALLLTAGLVDGTQATLLEGKIVTVQYLYPDSSHILDTGTNGDYVVSDAIEIPNFYFGFGSLDIGDTQLAVRFLVEDRFFTQSFNGIKLSVAPGTIDGFTSVDIDVLSNWMDFTADRITIGDDYILINWQGLSVIPGTSLVLNLNAPQQPIPEPATLALLAFALFGFAIMRRKI